MDVDRLLPTDEARDLIGLAAEIADEVLLPRAAQDEAAGVFPRDVFTTIGRAGLLGLPFPEELGGGGQPYVVYLQVLEELAARWLTVALGTSVHTLACFPLATFGSSAQQKEHLPAMVEGEQLGAYCLSEAQSGSDAAALSTRARLDGDAYVVDGTKAWITHGGVADFYSVMVRTSDDGPRGISCLLVDATSAGLSAASPERKMAMSSSPTAQVHLDGVRVPAGRRLGAEGEGFSIALAGLDAGRLGIAACATGLAQAALDTAVAWAKERRQFGRSILDFQGVSFMLADMATAVEASRALYVAAAARKDAGRPFGVQAAIAKLFCTDAAMRVTTDAVQVLGGYGYVQDYPAERYLREAKALQIVEGTNQVQRLVIGRRLAKG